MNRRDFLKLTGLAAGAVAFGGVSALSSPVVLDAPFVVGDVFTIAGYFSHNPVTGKPTGYLQNFVVTAISSSSIDFMPKFSDVPKRHRKQLLGTRA